MAQNTSHAVMAQRVEASDSLDDFPTPPWATRAFLNTYFSSGEVRDLSAWEPACGRGHMAQVLIEKFSSVRASDICDYGFGEVQDFVGGLSGVRSVDWLITNPPFRLAEDFLERGRHVARKGVALLTRTVFLESIGRFERVFKERPPTTVLQYVERVPMVKGRLDRKASTATGYAWLVWDFARGNDNECRLDWIPPSRKILDGHWDSTPAQTEKARPGAEPAMRLYLQYAAAPAGDVSGAFFHAWDTIHWSLDGVKSPVPSARDPWAAKIARIEPVGFALGNWKRRYRAQWRAIAADGSVLGLYDAYMRKKGSGQQLLRLDLYSPTATVQPKPMGKFCEFPGDTDSWDAAKAEKAAKRAAKEAERAARAAN